MRDKRGNQEVGASRSLKCKEAQIYGSASGYITKVSKDIEMIPLLASVKWYRPLTMCKDVARKLVLANKCGADLAETKRRRRSVGWRVVMRW